MKISPDKKFAAFLDGPKLTVFRRDKPDETYEISFDRYDLRKPDVFSWSRDSKAIAVFISRSLPPPAGEGPAYRNNYWVGLWFWFSGEFYSVRFEDQSDVQLEGRLINSIRLTTPPFTVICGVGRKELFRVRMPDLAMTTVWENELARVSAEKDSVTGVGPAEWTWNHDNQGYEGITFENGRLLYFQHSHNPFGGGGALTQDLRDFLDNGPAAFVPSEFLPEVAARVTAILAGK